MKTKGFIIDKEGFLTSFGIHGLSETVESGHEKSFESEIVDTTYFKKLNLYYDKNTTLYSNALRLSREGLIFVFNRQLNKFSPTQIDSYVP